MFITIALPHQYLYFRNHFRQRLKERYNIQISQNEYGHLNAALQKDIPFIISEDKKISMHCFWLKGRYVYILFDQCLNVAKTCFNKTQESWNIIVNKKK